MLKGMDIVQIDEAIFSGKTKTCYTYMARDPPIQLSGKGAPGKYLAVVLAASKNRGIIHWAYNVGKGINGKQFKEFLEQTCKKIYFSKYPGRIMDSDDEQSEESIATDDSGVQDAALPLDIAFFVDNASIHRYKPARNYCTHRHVPLIFNEPGRPDLMGVEKIWSIAKRAHSNNLKRHLALGEPIDLTRSVVQIMMELEDGLAMKCCLHALKAIQHAEPLEEKMTERG